jgi:DNA-directed RNA polymerase specialized sigma24 family protein
MYQTLEQNEKIKAHKQYDLFADVIPRLPKKPYVLPDKGFKMFITSLESAMRHNCRYIQQNTPWQLSFMVFDLDYKQAIYAHEKADLLAPSFYVVEPTKTTAHAVYALEQPVLRHHTSNDKPQRLFATLEQAYGEKMRADSGYSGLVMKNPFCEDYKVYLPEERKPLLYSLTDMAEYVDFDSINKKRLRKPVEIANAYSESRNVAVFDMVRKWAYKAIRDYWFGSYESWLSAVNQAVSEAWAGIESRFSKSDHDYLLSERRATAKSIAKWTWRNVTPASFELFVAKTHQPHLQRARQAKSVESRLIKTQDKRDQAIELRKGGMKQAEIAKLLGVTDRTIRNWLTNTLE